MVNQKNNQHGESKTMTHRFSKLPYDEDPWAQNNLLKSEAKEKHQLMPSGPSNRHEGPTPTNENEYQLYVGTIIESDAQLAGVQLKAA